MNKLEILQGVKDWTTISAVYDVSAHFPTGGVNGGNTYTLSGAIAMIPNGIRKGGMSIKFIQTSDNMYVQARCMAQNFTTDVTQWQGVDDEPTAWSDNLVKSGGVAEIIFDEFIVGKGNYSWIKIHFIPNHKYRIYVLNKDVYGSGSEKLALYYKNNDDYIRIAGTATASSPLADYYDFTAPDGAFDYRLYYTVQADEKAYLKIEDRTEVKDIDDKPMPDSNNLVQSGGVADTMAKGNIVAMSGNNGTVVSKTIKLIPGRAYTIVIDNPSWEYTQSAAGVKFGLYYNNGSTDVSLLYRTTMQSIASYYNFKTVEGIDVYYIKIRANSGQTVVFRIEPDSLQASDNQLSFNGNTTLEIEDVPATVDDYNRVTKSNYISSIAGYNLTKIDFVPNKLLSIPNTIAIGDTLDITPVDNNSWRYAIVDCNAGDMFTISSYATGSRYTFCYIDNNNKVVDVYTTRTYVNNFSSVATANATKLVISDANSNRTSFKGQNLLSRITDVRKNIIKALKNDGVVITKTSTGYSVKITQIRIKNLNTIIYAGGSSTFTFADSNAYLLVDMNTLAYRQEANINNITENDIVLLNYTAGVGFVGGLLFSEYTANELNKCRRGVVVVADDVLFNHNTVKWSAINIRIGSTSYPVPAAEYTFGAPTLIFRPSTGVVMQLGSMTQVADGDVLLLLYRDYKFVGGELIGYYNSQIRDLPKDTAHLNVYKKALQQKNLKWTPKAEVVANEGVHPAGVEVVGVPYSSVKEKMKFVGKSVSYHTFMTAVNDIHSLLYTERVGENNSQSAYGIEYHGTNCISYFGSVCSSYNSSMLGINSLLASWRFKMPAAGFSPLPNQDEQNVEVGDALAEPGHVLTCIKIERDSVGNIEYLTMAEQAAPVKVTKYTTLDLGNRRKMLNAVWARYNKLYDNVEYTPNPFVLVDNEYLYNVADVVFIDNQNADGTNTYYRCYKANSDAEFTVSNWRQILAFDSTKQYSYGDYCVNTINNITDVYKKLGSDITARAWNDIDWERVPCNEWASVPFTYNNDIVTFAGDRAAFGLTDLIYINYNLGSYTAMELFKEDTLIQTIPLSSGYQVNITNYINGAGRYKARLKNSSEYSNFTYFEVIDNTVNVTYNNNILNIVANIPFYQFNICAINGGFCSNEDENTASVTKTTAQLIAMLAAEEESPADYSENLYCRVLFQGEYGQVPSVMTKIMDNCDTGEWSFIHEDESISLGEISETANVAIVGDLQGHSFVFDVFTEIQNVSVNVVPIKGEIQWLDTLPQEMSPGHIYQISIVNGIGSIKTNAS